jgi:arginyl-tRNA synthetase
MKRRVAEETRKRREDWDEPRVAAAAWTIAEGAMKFGMLKQDNDRPIVFDMEAALSFDGFTGPYVQYAHARLSSILAKAKGTVPEGGLSPSRAPGVGEGGTDDPAEFAVLKLLSEYPGAVKAAAAAFRPSVLAQYLFDLAQASNDFYRDVPVLSSTGEERERRLAVTRAVRAALRNGLDLLGIAAPDEM